MITLAVARGRSCSCPRDEWLCRVPMKGDKTLGSGVGVEAVLASVQEAVVTVTGSSLVGLCLFGSLATGNFEEDVSDVDLIAVRADPPGDARRPRRQSDRSRNPPFRDGDG